MYLNADQCSKHKTAIVKVIRQISRLEEIHFWFIRNRLWIEDSLVRL